jgi:hypothetical protein
VDVAGVVKLVHRDGEVDSGARKNGRRASTGTANDRKQIKGAVTARQPDNGTGGAELGLARRTYGPVEYGRRLVEAVTDEPHRPGARFTVEACRLAQVDESVFVNYFLQATKGKRRDVLNGWREWFAYCKANDYTAQDMVEERRPEVAFARFVQYMGKAKTPEYLVARAKPTVKELFGALGKPMVENPFVQVIVKSNTTKTRSGPKYSEIWNLGILLK